MILILKTALLKVVEFFIDEMDFSHYSIQLPRNYNFIARLPEYFDIEIITKGNVTSEGIWYYVRIKNHELNILSRVDLREGKKYQIRKKGHMSLELADQKPEENSKSNHDYSG